MLFTSDIKHVLPGAHRLGAKRNQEVHQVSTPSEGRGRYGAATSIKPAPDHETGQSPVWTIDDTDEPMANGIAKQF